MGYRWKSRDDDDDGHDEEKHNQIALYLIDIEEKRENKEQTPYKGGGERKRENRARLIAAAAARERNETKRNTKYEHQLGIYYTNTHQVMLCVREREKLIKKKNEVHIKIETNFYIHSPSHYTSHA